MSMREKITKIDCIGISVTVISLLLVSVLSYLVRWLNGEGPFLDIRDRGSVC